MNYKTQFNPREQPTRNFLFNILSANRQLIRTSVHRYYYDQSCRMDNGALSEKSVHHLLALVDTPSHLNF